MTTANCELFHLNASLYSWLWASSVPQRSIAMYMYMQACQSKHYSVIIIIAICTECSFIPNMLHVYLSTHLSGRLQNY